MNADDTEELVQATAHVLVKAVLDLIQGDPHQWSARPCQTCRTVTSIVGKPFGCHVRAEQEAKLRAEKERGVGGA